MATGPNKRLYDSKESIMKRFLIVAAVLALATVGADRASARGGHSGPSARSAYSGRGYYAPVSRNSFVNRSFYRGYRSINWNYQYWYPSYGCYLYWVPSGNCYYYWCVPDNCYYPISYSPYGRYAW